MPPNRSEKTPAPLNKKSIHREKNRAFFTNLKFNTES